MSMSVRIVDTASPSNFRWPQKSWVNTTSRRSLMKERLPMIAYRGPTLITEPELRWPIVLLAAAISALLAMLTAGLYYVAMTQLHHPIFGGHKRAGLTQLRDDH